MSISGERLDIRTGKVHGARAPSGGAQAIYAEAPRVLVWMAVLFVLIAVGRINEMVPGLSKLPLVKISLGTALIALIAHWRALPRIDSSISKPFNSARWLGVLVLASVPFSIWPGPSVVFLYTVLPVLVMAMILMVKLSGQWSTLRTVLFSLVVAGGALSLVALTGYVGGRIEVASMYDTNDLAFVLVTLLPLTVAFGLIANTSTKRLVFFGLTGAFAASILLTSSRGGLLGLFAGTIVLVLDRGQIAGPAGGARKRKATGRVLVPLVLAVMAGVATWPVLPPETQERLASIMNLGTDYNVDPENDTGRLSIWKRGMTALGQRPIGYGVSAYRMVDLRFGGRMLAPHNSVVQIAVELGVIALLLYLRLFWLTRRGLVSSLRGLRALDDPTQEQREQAVFCRALQASLVSCFVSGLFLSMAFASVTWVAIGVALACTSLVYRQIPSQTGALKHGVRR